MRGKRVRSPDAGIRCVIAGRVEPSRDIRSRPAHGAWLSGVGNCRMRACVLLTGACSVGMACVNYTRRIVAVVIDRRGSL